MAKTGFESLNAFVASHDSPGPTDAAIELQGYLEIMSKSVEPAEEPIPENPEPSESVSSEMETPSYVGGPLTPGAQRESRARDHALAVNRIQKARQGPMVSLENDLPQPHVQALPSMFEQTTLCKSCGTRRPQALTSCEHCEVDTRVPRRRFRPVQS